MRIIKHAVCLVLTALLFTSLFSVAPVYSFAAEAKNSCGDEDCSGITGGCSWEYDSVTKTLTVAAGDSYYDDYTRNYYNEGEMPDYWGDEDFRRYDLDNPVMSEGEDEYYYEMYGMNHEDFLRMAYTAPWNNHRMNDIETIENIVIGDGVKNIGSNSFSESKITSLTIPSSVTNIGSNSFSGSNITSLTIPGNVKTIGVSAFGYCRLLTDLTLEDGIESIQDEAFRYCDAISVINLPNTLKVLGSNVFSAVKNKKLVLPDSLEYIGRSFCTSNNSLKTIQIGKNTKNIGDGAFSNCLKLTGFIVSEDNNYYTEVNGNLYTKDMKNLVVYCNGKKDTYFEIPDGVETLKPYAFTNPYYLESIIIPTSVTNIADDVFIYGIKDIYYLGSEAQWNNITKSNYKCSQWINDPDHELTFLGDDSFVVSGNLSNGNWEYNKKTQTLTINAASIPNYCRFQDYNSAYEPDDPLPEDEGKTNDQVFSPEEWVNKCMPWLKYSNKITKVVLNDGLSFIGRNAFYGLTNLTEVEIPSSVKFIGSNAFGGCEKLKNVVFIGNNIEEVSGNAFEGCYNNGNVNIFCTAEESSVSSAFNSLANGSVNYDSNPLLDIGLDKPNSNAPLTAGLAASYDGNRFDLNNNLVYKKASVLGVQKKEAIATEAEGRGLRFIAELSSEYLNAEDYGFEVVKTSHQTSLSFNNANGFTKMSDLLSQNSSNIKEYSCKNTYNNVADKDYGDRDPKTTDYKYVTLAINDIPYSQGIAVRFYIKIDGKKHYASYNNNDGTFRACATSYSTIAAN